MVMVSLKCTVAAGVGFVGSVRVMASVECGYKAMSHD